ncbi:MAG: GNAT family N-acetyltransferase [Bacteroidales bacterium]|nr:GNAT family N-acetyltransferase [Bacteroidales bacterium]
MKEVIPPVDKELIERELTKDKFLRNTNNANNRLYILTSHDSPNTMREIGRLREITFRLAGGGTGKEADIDDYDTAEIPYKQLIVWDPQQRDILGGYRYMLCGDLRSNEEGEAELATGKLFHFSDEFKKNYIPRMIELGRSFVQPAYQSTNRNKKSLYALDNLWDGLGALWKKNPEYIYFFGKVTMYTSYNREARNLILYFLEKHFKGPESLLYPYNPLTIDIDEDYADSILTSDNFQDDLKLLSQAVRARGEVIPPLINSYINLSPTLQCFGTVLNDHFGNVEETAILLTIKDMYPEKIERHIKTYDR